MESNASVHAVATAARARFGDALCDVVPGHETVLLVWADQMPDEVALRSDLTALRPRRSTFRADPKATAGQQPQALTIGVVYDGPDLERAAAALSLSADALIELHTGTEFTVAFMGFAPGFPYLIAGGVGVGAGAGVRVGVGAGAGDGAAAALLALPRLATPRTEVPAGSVAVAAGYGGIYPRRSPGGWNLLGRTDAVLFDPGREPPALLEPGMTVRFRSI